MSKEDIPDRVKEFVFNSVDSVELLEVVFLLRADPTKVWDAESLSNELRSSPTSMKGRLKTLKSLKLIQERSNPKGYVYSPSTHELDLLLGELFVEYQTKRHRVLELIFSPLKRARDFADAFRLSSSEEDEDGEEGSRG